MSEQVQKILKVFILAFIAVALLKLLGFAINLIVSILIPALIIYALYKILIKKEDVLADFRQRFR